MAKSIGFQLTRFHLQAGWSAYFSESDCRVIQIWVVIRFVARHAHFARQSYRSPYAIGWNIYADSSFPKYDAALPD